MVGAYFPCFNQLTAANEILHAYRRFYPDGTVVMVNDAGDVRHKALGTQYRCQYFYEEDNLGYPGGCAHYAQIIRWVQRFLHYIPMISDEWFVLLEDDVLIMGAVNESTLQYDINGINPANILPWHAGIHARGYHLDKSKFIYGAMGGAIFRTAFFKQMALQMDVVAAITAFGEACPQSLTGQNWYYSDVVLSYLAYFYNGTLGQYPGFAELWFRDLGQRLQENRVATLNQYKHLYNYPVHPHLTELKSNQYTIVLPTRGSGDAFDLFITHALPRYAKFLDRTEIDQFILICPTSNIERLKTLIASIDLPFVVVADEDLYGEENSKPLAVDGKLNAGSGSTSVVADGWMRQQIHKLRICSRIRTEHYLILDDDLFITKPLRFADFFDVTGRIYYSHEAWPTSLVPKPGEPHFATNPQWWISAAKMHGVPFQALIRAPNLMGVTPQLMITRIVHQMLHALGDTFIETMVATRATEFCLYWIFIMKTLRTHYYTPSTRLFAMDNNCNILLQHLSKNQVQAKIITGLTQKPYTFIVIQSWIRYPLDWIIPAIEVSA